MKKLKSFSAFIVLAIIIATVAVFTGCSANTNASKCVTGIEQSDGGGYVITYSDGSTTEMSFGGQDGQNGANGKNGADGKDLTVEDLFEAYKAESGDEDATLAEFLEKYLTFTVDTAQVINDCLRSSVSIYTEFIETTSGFFGQQSGIAISSGSGVIFGMDDNYVYAATNFHVVYDANADKAKNGGTNFARKITCYLYGSESYPAKVDNDGDGKPDTDNDGYYVYDYDDRYALSATLIGSSAEADIAVIRLSRENVDNLGGSAKAAEFAETYRVGQTAIAIGNPESEGISVTEGIVSVDNENIVLSVDGTKRYHRSMRIDTAIYHGSSGGGLFDANGKLIGITNAGNEDDQNINYAIPLQVVKGTIDNIMYYYGQTPNAIPVSAKRITVGFTVVSSDARYEYDAVSGYGKIVEDITVKEITAGSLAQRLGLAAGDKLTAITISGKTYNVNRSFDISDALLAARKTDTLSVSYIRNGVGYTTDAVSLESETFNKIA